MKKTRRQDQMTSAAISRKAMSKLKSMAEKDGITQTECLERIVEDAVRVRSKRSRLIDRLKVEDMTPDEKLSYLVRKVDGLEKGQHFIKGVLKVQEDKLIGPSLELSSSTSRVVCDILEALKQFQ